MFRLSAVCRLFVCRMPKSQATDPLATRGCILFRRFFLATTVPRRTTKASRREDTTHDKVHSLHACPMLFFPPESIRGRYGRRGAPTLFRDVR